VTPPRLGAKRRLDVNIAAESYKVGTALPRSQGVYLFIYFSTMHGTARGYANFNA
jgi:hypothetical protein